MSRFFKSIAFVILIILINFQFLLTKVEAATVNINVNREFIVQNDATVKIREEREVVNNTTDRSITKEGNIEVFNITALYDDVNNQSILNEMLASVSVKSEDGWNISYTVELQQNAILIKAAYPVQIDPQSSFRFIFEYTNTQLARKSGALTDIYIQAFSKDFNFNGQNVTYTYNTKLKIPSNFGELNFITPNPARTLVEGDFTVYYFNQTQLLGNFVWAQIGKVQFYSFQITQELKATEELNTGNFNEYRMIIPRSIDALEVIQTTYFTKISPEPKYIEEDSDGNLIGVFNLPSHKTSVIEITGYAVVSKEQVALASDYGVLADYDNINSIYTSPAPFWESDSEEIISKATSLKGDKTSVSEILENTYSDIVNSIDYSNVKRFGINERQGALKTLQGGAAVCMEYSDLYIALLRAQGIPARAAFGYGYDSRDPSDGQELHQWAQVFIPTQNKWLNVDVTWGENGPALIGVDMNHFLTHVASIDPNTPPTLSGKAFGSSPEFGEMKFIIDVLDYLPEEPKFSEEELLQKYQPKNQSVPSLVADSFIAKLNAGIESLMADGLDLRNSAQVILFTTGGVILVSLILLISLIIKLVKKRQAEKSLHSINSLNSQ